MNCLIGPSEANNNDLESGEWVFLSSLLSQGKNLSIEELLAAVPDSPKSDEEQLREIAMKLESDFDAFIKALTEF